MIIVVTQPTLNLNLYLIRKFMLCLDLFLRIQNFFLILIKNNLNNFIKSWENIVFYRGVFLGLCAKLFHV